MAAFKLKIMTPERSLRNRVPAVDGSLNGTILSTSGWRIIHIRKLWQNWKLWLIKVSNTSTQSRFPANETTSLRKTSAMRLYRLIFIF
ncbi:hypothetical protein ACLUWT_03555 [Limosilactobacillus mucosae]